MMEQELLPEEDIVVIIAQSGHASVMREPQEKDAPGRTAELDLQETIGNLDEGQLRRLDEQLVVMHQLVNRRRTGLASTQRCDRPTELLLTDGDEAMAAKTRPRNTPRSRSRRRQAGLCAAVMCTILLIVTLSLDPDRLKIALSGSDVNTLLSQSSARIARQLDQSAWNRAAIYDQNAMTDKPLEDGSIDNKIDERTPGRLRRPDVAAASTMMWPTPGMETDDALRPGRTSASLEAQRAKEALQHLAENHSTAMSQLSSGSGGPLLKAQLSGREDPRSIEREVDFAPDGPQAMTSRPMTAIKVSRLVPDTRYWVQVMATFSETEALLAWGGQSQGDVGSTVSVMKPRIVRTETTMGTLYGIHLGPFQDRRKAGDLCTWLKEQNSDCSVVARSVS